MESSDSVDKKKIQPKIITNKDTKKDKSEGLKLKKQHSSSNSPVQVKKR